MEDKTRSNEYPHPWKELFKWYSNAFYGSVNSIEEARDIIDEFSEHTKKTYYVESRSTKQFGMHDFYSDVQHHFVRFKEETKVKNCSLIKLDGIPLMIVGSKLMGCHQGTYRRGPKVDEQHLDHNYKQTSKKGKVTRTKQLGCPAVLCLREVILFPEYKIPRDTHHCRQETSVQLRADLQSIHGEEDIYRPPKTRKPC